MAAWRVAVGCLAAAGLAAVIGCRPGPPRATDAKPTVVVSIAPQAWLVKQLGGARVDVVTIVKPGASPATYQPTDAEVSRIMTAAMYFRIGVPFENGPWFEAIRASEELQIVDVRRGIVLREMARHVHPEEEEAAGRRGEQGEDHDRAEVPFRADAPGHDQGKDPHVWLSPRLLKVQAATVAEALGRLDPAHEDEYGRNLRALQARLDEIDASIRRRLEPVRGRAFFVFHPAWGYFAREYGLRQVAVQLEGKEPSDHELSRLQQQARQEGIQVVFVQPQISGKSAGVVAAAIGGRVEKIDPLAADLPEGLVRAADALLESQRAAKR